ncbi:MAG: UDP-N-acetylmuramoyl-L-alanyl-D-glutamate--2,6-diaminopimelate ligase [bacterium]|nr:UDP-N-acetylmuramoyl-L-alanyl-D-glutamate--2,6-diaminopimelate ligase [bacterium]
MEFILRAVKKIIPPFLFRVLQPVYHFALAFLAALIFGFPSKKIKVIGVTGTDGKSSAVEILHEILRNAGFSVASASSLRFKINSEEEVNLKKMTMPGRFFTQRFLLRAVKAGTDFAILEVTSEGIRQFRHKFIEFDGALLTNLTPEHIESHGSFENYREAKEKLFSSLPGGGFAVINRDDPSWKHFSDATRAQKIFYSKEAISENGTFHRVSGVERKGRISFEIEGVRFESNLFGAFNVMNILAAVAMAHAFGVSFMRSADALKKISGVPGRLEIVAEKSFRVVVDYAHTPNALKSVYGVLKDAFPSSKLICVLGAAGGGRDKWKRSEFGKIAGEFCGEIILTNEDPYDESPREIVDQIASSIQHSAFSIQHLRRILDRRMAIHEALHLAKPDDTVIITGKGAEQWIMGPANIKIPWDDRRVVREELGNL